VNDTIAFAIPGAGVHTLMVSNLPTTNKPVTIDGYTQPGSSANTNGPNLGSNAVILIEVNIAIGFLAVGGGNSTVRGLAVNGYRGILPVKPGRNTVAGNFLGINAAGTAAPAHANTGVQDIQVNSPNNTIGGTTPAARNVISGVATPPASSNNGITVTAD